LSAAVNEPLSLWLATGARSRRRGHAYKRHILTSKGTKRKRQLDKDVMLDKADVPKIKRMIPY